MPTSSITFTIPPSMRQWLERQVAAQGSNEEQFLRNPLIKEQRRQARKEVEKALLEGLASGPGEQLTDAHWKEIRATGRKSRGKKSGK